MTTELYYTPLTLTVAETDEGMKVRSVLERRLGVSRKLMSRLKQTEEGITLNGERVYASYRVKAGDVLTIRMEQESSDDIFPQAMDLDIVFEDEYLLVVNKRAGIVVHPTIGHYTGTLANGIVHHWKERGERVRFRPVHRLDEFTSGLVAIAKNPYIHQQMSEQHGDGTIEKRYLAFVYGVPGAASLDTEEKYEQNGTVNQPIDRDSINPHVRIVTPEGILPLLIMKRHRFMEITRLLR